MRERAGVYDDGGTPTTSRVDGIDEVALMVRLQVLDRQPMGGGRLGRGGTWSSSVAVP